MLQDTNKPTRKERLILLWDEYDGICQHCRIKTNYPNFDSNQVPADSCRGKKYKSPDIRYFILNYSDSNEILLCYTCHQLNSKGVPKDKPKPNEGLLIRLLSKINKKGTLSDKRIRQIKVYYEHFRKRLEERYYMDIGFIEFAELHKLELSQINKGRKSIIGYLLISGRMVLVAKRDGFIRTALPMEHKSTLKYLK